MSVDAACTACCCTVAPPVCCFPDISKPLEVNFVQRSSVFAGTTEVIRTLVSAQIATTMLRSGDATSGYVMKSSGGTAALRYQTFARVAKASSNGISCPGFQNDYICPPCNSFVECQSFDWIFSGGLASDSLSIRCQDPCNPFSPTRRTFGIFFDPQSGQFIGTATTRSGNTEPDQVAFCGPPLVDAQPLDLLGLGQLVLPTIWGREGCLASSTFSSGHVPGTLVPDPSDGWSGPCAPNPTYSALIDCDQWRTNPSYLIPERMSYTASGCSVLRCNPFNGNASNSGSPLECILFDCNGNVVSYSVSGCDTIYPGNGQGTACEISVRGEVSLSASVVYG
jgi:hypothetical protein